MKIQFDCPDKINGLLTLTVEQADYQEKVDKQLKEYRKKAQVPGFRPGTYPLALIKKQYGKAVKAETIDKVLSEQLYNYIKDNKINMLGEPMVNDEHQIDIESDGPFEFKFDIAVAPEFEAKLSGRDKIEYYKIKVDDKIIDRQVAEYAMQAGEMVKGEKYDGDRDTLIGDLRELDAEGNTKEGGLTADAAQMMPAFFRDEDQKKLFADSKPGDIITFNPKKANGDNDAETAALLKVEKEQVKDLTADFSFQITEVRHFQPAEVNQALFDRIFGEGNVKDEADFRQKTAAILSERYAESSDFVFMRSVKKHMEKKVGKLQFPDELLKRFINSKRKEGQAPITDEEYQRELEGLKWSLIQNQLVEANDVKVENDDLRAVAKETVRQQFGFQLPDEYLDNYVDSLLNNREAVDQFINRAVETKLMKALKNVVKLDEKEVTLDEFNKLLEEK